MLLRKIAKRLDNYIRPILGKLLDVENVNIHGVEINVKHQNISSELKRFFYNKSYEGEEVAILKKCLSKNDVVMEVGAGIGFLSTFCARYVGDDNVFAYEANPFMIDKIKETYSKNHVTPKLFNCILSNSAGSESFFLEDNFWSSSTIKRSSACIETKVKKLDINDEVRNNSPTLVIIDIEGGEKDLVPIIATRGSRINKLIIELHPHIIGDAECTKVIQQVIEKGFNINFSLSRSPVFLFERVAN
ncbi:FkbM family methyltransferase [Marinobacter nauticus]